MRYVCSGCDIRASHFHLTLFFFSKHHKINSHPLDKNYKSGSRRVLQMRRGANTFPSHNRLPNPRFGCETLSFPFLSPGLLRAFPFPPLGMIEWLPLVTIETFDADLRSDHECWIVTTPLLSPHGRIPSVSVLAATNEGFECVCVCVRERERERNEIATTQILIHKGSIYRTTYVGCKLKSSLKCICLISYGIPKTT